MSSSVVEGLLSGSCQLSHSLHFLFIWSLKVSLRWMLRAFSDLSWASAQFSTILGMYVDFWIPMHMLELFEVPKDILQLFILSFLINLLLPQLFLLWLNHEFSFEEGESWMGKKATISRGTCAKQRNIKSEMVSWWEITTGVDWDLVSQHV